MTKRPDPRETLLAETFQGGDWADGPAGGFARRAAAAARRRRFVRGTIVASGAAAGIAAAVMFALLHRPTEPPFAAPPAITATAPAYEIISDDELLAQLRDRPVLTVKRENGTREIVLLEN
jgi:hypothetical protein